MSLPVVKKVVFGVTVDHAVPYHELLAAGLVANGWEVHFVSSGGMNLRRLDSRIIKHEIEMARQPSFLKDLKSALKWARVIQKVKPDLVIAGTPKASMLGIIFSHLLGVQRRVYWVHGLRLETAKGLFFKLLLIIEKMTSKNATDLISVSRSLTKQLIELGIAAPQKIHLIGQGSTQGVDLERFYPLESEDVKRAFAVSIGLKDDTTVLGFVGRLTIDKGIREFKGALEALHGQGHNFQVLFVGEFEDEESSELVSELVNLGIPIIKTGHVSDTSKYYQVMDIFCLPSYREGLPNVVLEAYATRIAVVGTRVTGISDLIIDGETGLLVAPGDSLELQRAIEGLLTYPDLALKISNAGFKYVHENFDSKKVVERQVDFFESLLEMKILSNGAFSKIFGKFK